MDTPAGGAVVLRAHRSDDGVAIEVEDACGGIPDGTDELFQPFGERRGRNRIGLGPRTVDRAKGRERQGGDIRIRNAPGKGCTFIIEVPAAAAPAAAAHATDTA